jgi:hypothetical protein
MAECIVADSSFYCCFESDISKQEDLLFLLKKYDFFLGQNITNEIPETLRNCDEFADSINFIEGNFFELVRPVFGRSKEHETDGEYEAIGIAYHLNEHFNLKNLILDDFIAYKFTKRNFEELSKKLTRTIGFVKDCCYLEKTVSPEKTLNILSSMKKSFEQYEKDVSQKRKRPCSLDEKVYKQILIPLIIQIEDDHKNGRI